MFIVDICNLLRIHGSDTDALVWPGFLLLLPAFCSRVIVPDHFDFDYGFSRRSREHKVACSAADNQSELALLQVQSTAELLARLGGDADVVGHSYGTQIYHIREKGKGEGMQD